MPLSLVLLGRQAGLLLCLSLVGVVSAGCAPVLDWREVRPVDSDAIAMFPCKPTTDARLVRLAGVRVRMVLVACQAADVTWALAFADMTDAARVTQALQDLRSSNVGNLRGTPSIIGPMRIDGMTPNPQAERVRVHGQLPDGHAVDLEVGLFARGTTVYQATVMGEALDPEAVSGFFEGLKLRT